jgi:hypothetical protein
MAPLSFLRLEADKLPGGGLALEVVWEGSEVVGVAGMSLIFGRRLPAVEAPFRLWAANARGLSTEMCLRLLGVLATWTRAEVVGWGRVRGGTGYLVCSRAYPLCGRDITG